jgi:flagellar motor switch protein FliM
VPPAHVFDFREPLPMPAGASGLVAAVEDAAPRVGLLLGLSCGRAVGVTTTGVRRMALVEVATPGAVWAPLSCGLPDPGLLLVPAATTVALADLALGGTGALQDRPTTALEQQLMVQHLVPSLRPLADALYEHGVTSLRAGAASDKPLPVGGGEVVAIALEVALPTGATASLAVCLPAKSLLPADVDPVPAQPTSTTARALADVTVEVSLRLPATTVSAVEVEDLHPGDVIRLEAEALSALVGVLTGQDADVPVLTAALGRQGRRRAVRVGSPYGGQ